MKTLTGILFWTLTGLMICNLVLVACFAWLKYEFHQHALGEVTPIISGVEVDGSQWHSQPASCRVIRVTEDDCQYCRSDEASYAAFRQAATQVSCEILEIAPRAGDMRKDARDGVVQLKYIDVDIGPSMFPLMTPMTFILDGNWKVKWMRRGTFSELALEDGIRALQEGKKMKRGRH